ncbi:MAG: DUF58 domain-containing protein [Anaerolineae bacterium]|nr:DUF58 domain-containing protein [Anaerolineae bacterium]
MFFFTLLLMLLIAIWLHEDIFFKIIYLFAMLYMLSRLWVRRFGKKQTFRRSFITRAFVGETVDVVLSIENNDWLPILGLELREDLPIDIISSGRVREAFSLRAKEKKIVDYTLRCRHRGFFPVGPLHIGTFDLLGIIPQKELTIPATRLTVYPHVVPLEELGLPTRFPFAELPTPSPLFEDPCRVIGVRDYRTGDSPRRIHWKATARSGRLLVKRYKPAIARETLICLDFDEESYDLKRRYEASELAVTAAASIANHIVGHEGLAAGLATWAHNPALGHRSLFSLPPRSGQGHLLTLLEALALVQLTKDASFIDLLRQQKGTLSWGATMIVITGNKSQALLDTLLYLRQVGLAVALLLVHPGKASLDFDDPAGIPVYQIWNESDLEKGF